MPRINKLNEKARYIHENPVRKSFVLNPEDWNHSSAKFRKHDNPGLCPIKLDYPWN